MEREIKKITNIQSEGWLARGADDQVNNYQGEWKKTAKIHMMIIMIYMPHSEKLASRCMHFLQLHEEVAFWVFFHSRKENRVEV